MNEENKKKHYLIYQTINLVNNKIYIGKHITENIEDQYFGSGKYLQNAIKKYGLENFEFRILFELQNEEEMNLLEKYVVTQEFCDRKDTYNINVGGDGGWNYVNKNRTSLQRSIAAKNTWNNYSEIEKNNFKNKISIGQQQRIINMSKEEREQFRKNNSQKAKNGFSQAFRGKKHTIESKQKISNTKHNNPLIGEKNGMHGKHWYHDPITNECKPFVEGEQPDGWIRGIDPIRSKSFAKNLPHNNATGKIQIYNSVTDTLKFIFPDEPIPEGFKIGGRPLSESGKQKLRDFYRKNNEENIAPKRIAELRPQYEYYLKYGWDKFKNEFNYKYTQSNFIGLCKRYLPEYKSRKQS